jgi:hypothetical protein
VADSPFGTFNDKEPFAIFDGVGLRAIAGDQVFLGHVTYAPVTMTIGAESRELGAGDVCVVNRGVEHELHSAGGVTFVEALGPVPLDHIPDRERDLVLGDLEGSLHVDK